MGLVYIVCFALEYLHPSGCLGPVVVQEARNDCWLSKPITKCERESLHVRGASPLWALGGRGSGVCWRRLGEQYTGQKSDPWAHPGVTHCRGCLLSLPSGCFMAFFLSH